MPDSITLVYGAGLLSTADIESIPIMTSAETLSRNALVYPSNASQSTSWVPPRSVETGEFDRAFDRLSLLLSLPSGWDTYGGERIDAIAVRPALRLTAALISTGATPPAIVPTSDGGVQLEWHGIVDLEIEFAGNGPATFYFRDAMGATEEGSIDPTTLEHVAKLTARAAIQPAP